MNPGGDRVDEDEDALAAVVGVAAVRAEHRAELAAPAQLEPLGLQPAVPRRRDVELDLGPSGVNEQAASKQ